MNTFGFVIKTDLYRQKENGEIAKHLIGKGRDVRQERRDEITRQEGKALEAVQRYFGNRKPKNQKEADYIADKIYKGTVKSIE